MATRDQPLHLFDLPVDILSLILRYLLTTNCAIQLFELPSANNSNNGGTTIGTKFGVRDLPTCPTDVLLVHPSLYAVACPILYEGNAFELDLSGERANHVKKMLAASREGGNTGGLDDLGVAMDGSATWGRRTPGHRTLLEDRDVLRRVRRLHLKIDRLRGWIGELIVPLVADMIVHGSVTDLSITILSPPDTRSVSGRSSLPSNSQRKHPSQKQQSHYTFSADSSIFTKPPLSGLLSLLADPYLHGAKLYGEDADQRWPAWSRIGSRASVVEEDAKTTSDEDDENESSTSTADDGRELVEIDWREIMRQVDPDGKETPREWAEDLAVRNRVM